jgi:hypothetical protein
MKNKLTKALSVLLIMLLIIIIALLLISCQKKKAELPKPMALSAEEAQNFIAIKNPERVQYNTFSMVKPGEWKDFNPEEYKNIVVFLPPESNISEPFDEKISLMLGILPENETRSLREITDIDLEMAKKGSPPVDTVSVNDARVGQLDGLKVILTTRVENQTIEMLQFRAMAGKRVYAITHQCLQGACKYDDVFNEMVQSFEWKNP